MGDVMEDDAARSFAGRRATGETWVGVFLLACGTGLGVLLSGGDGDLGYLVVVTVVVLVAAVAVLVVDARRARTVTASQAGVVLVDAVGRRRVVPWSTVRRVRTYRELGFPGRDEHLELVDGSLVALPARLPDGTLERWRRELGAPEPGPDRPPTPGARVWRIPVAKIPSWGLVMQLPTLVFLASGPWAGYSVVLLTLALTSVAVVAAIAHRQDRREVRADAYGLTLPRFRGPLRVAWTDIAVVGGLSGRWDDEPRLELHDGSTVALPRSVPATVVAQWRDELEPGAEAPPHRGTEAN